MKVGSAPGARPGRGEAGRRGSGVVESRERAVVNPISHLGKLRPGEVAKLSQGHSSIRLGSRPCLAGGLVEVVAQAGFVGMGPAQSHRAPCLEDAHTR